MFHFKRMGVKASFSKTSDFFIANFGESSSFIYETENGDKILFSYKESEIKKDHFKVYAEKLTQPENSSLVTIRANKNCDCKSDVSRFEPACKFDVYFYELGFYNKKYPTKDQKFKYFIQELEKELS